jgi:hypothetical protein
VERKWKSNGGWMARTGCVSAAAICTCAPARTRCDRQVLPAYGLQDLPIKEQSPPTESNLNTMCLPITLGENHGSGHFYLAQTRTFLLCVDTNLPPEQVLGEINLVNYRAIPDKRGNRTSKVLGKDMSDNPTNRLLKNGFDSRF